MAPQKRSGRGGALQRRNADQDSRAPIPFIRRGKSDYTPETTTFTYYTTEKHTVKRTVTTTGASPTTTETREEVEEEVKHKVYLPIYYMDPTKGEDTEHFFQAFHDMKREMRSVWETTSANKTNDAKNLFYAFERMLDGTALEHWRATLANQNTTNRNWEDFKPAVAEFITAHVLREKAYAEQILYMRDRVKPIALSPKEWLNRLKVMQLSLPYMIGSLEEFKKEVDPDARTAWEGWWKKGAMSDAELLHIIENKCPISWINKREEINMTDYTAESLVLWYEKIHEREAAQERASAETRRSHDTNRQTSGQVPRKSSGSARRGSTFSRRQNNRGQYRPYGSNNTRGASGSQQQQPQSQQQSPQRLRQSKRKKRREEEALINEQASDVSSDSVDDIADELYYTTIQDDGDTSSDESDESASSSDSSHHHHHHYRQSSEHRSPRHHKHRDGRYG